MPTKAFICIAISPHDMRDLQSQMTVLAVGAHPDDVEFQMAGTLALMHKGGIKIHVATVCNGDKGSVTLTPEEIASRRFREATASARILDASFETVGVPDLELVFENKTRARITELVRRVDPDIVITSSPDDYMPDHEITSELLWDACFNASVPNYKTAQLDAARPAKRIPYLYYSDSSEGVDRFGRTIVPDFYIDIISVIDVKEEMLAKHESQRSWLSAQHGIDDYVISMRRHAERRGGEVNVKFAEVFRQHKCPPFPQDNVFEEIIPSYLLKAR